LFQAGPEVGREANLAADIHISSAAGMAMVFDATKGRYATPLLFSADKVGLELTKLRKKKTTKQGSLPVQGNFLIIFIFFSLKRGYW
jgi:hypothetical protein